MYHEPECRATILSRVNIRTMFNINKIKGHIKMLEFEQLKLTRYAEEATRFEKRDPKREADIQRALTRVNNNIDLWTKKLGAFADAPPEKPVRNNSISHDQGGPLIG